jgi:hypothetical protein
MGRDLEEEIAKGMRRMERIRCGENEEEERKEWGS